MKFYFARVYPGFARLIRTYHELLSIITLSLTIKYNKTNIAAKSDGISAEFGFLPETRFLVRENESSYPCLSRNRIRAETLGVL